MSTKEQAFEEAWSEGEDLPAQAEHAKKKATADAERTAEAEAYANSWKELKGD